MSFSQSQFPIREHQQKNLVDLVDFLAIKVRGKGEGGTESIPKGNVSDYFE